MNREGIITKVKIKLDEVTPEGIDLPFDDIIGPILDECAKDVAKSAPLHFLIPVSMIYKTLTREIDTNVAILGLSTTHNLKPGDIITVSGITTHLEYNGTFTITAVTETTISYSLTHNDETQTSDTGGVISLVRIFSASERKYYLTVPSRYLRLYEIKFPAWPISIRETVKIGSLKGKMDDNSYLQSWNGTPAVVIKTLQPAGGILAKYLVCSRVTIDSIPIALYVEIPEPENLPDDLIDALTWLTSSKVLQISGEAEKASGAMQQYALSIATLTSEIK